MTGQEKKVCCKACESFGYVELRCSLCGGKGYILKRKRKKIKEARDGE